MSTVLGTPTFDAQMSDYSNQGDLDVLMQAHSTDPWTAQDDGIMEEDSSFSMLTAKNSDSATPGMFMPATTEGTDQQNEVEMEDYEHHSEYEMLDESEVIVEDDDHSRDTIQEEIVDVEVVDLQPSPETSLTMVAPPVLELRPEDALASEPSPLQHLDIVPEAAHEVPASEVAGTIGEHPITDNAIVETAPSVEGDSGETQAAAQELSLDDQAHGLHDAPSEVEHPELHAQEPPIIVSSAAILSTVEVAPSEVAASETLTASKQPREVKATIDEADVGEHVEVGSNPHEIADGIFIEPVPAVIVQATFSEQPYVLFNRPPTSRPHSPSPDDDVPPDTAVLLQDRPTLYYGPLSDLFLALREEEVLVQQPDLHHAELGFIIETLELSITEDNIHAKEFSLFQLNTLHDSFHTGSLRVTLFQQAPRFIARYHELQEHLNQLGDHSNEDANLTAAPPTTGESMSEQTVATHEVHTDEVHPGDSPQVVQLQEPVVVHPEQHPQAEDVDPKHQEQRQGDLIPPSIVDNHSGLQTKDGAQGVESHGPEEHVEAGLPAIDQPSEPSEEAQIEASLIGGGDKTLAAASAQGDEVSHPDYTLVTEQQRDFQSGHDVGPLEQPGEGAGVVTEGGEFEPPAEDEQDAHEVEDVVNEEDAVEEVEHSVESEAYEHEGDEQYGDEDHEHEEEEYDLEAESNQVVVDELQEDIVAVEDPEPSGEILNEENQGEEHIDERSPSPGAEDELPPIDTDLLQAVDTEQGDLSASASTQESWTGEHYDEHGEDEAQYEETLHSHSEDGNEDANDYIDEHSLLHQEGEEHAEWDHDADAEADPSWDGEYDEEQPASGGEVSVRSKRGFHEVDGDDDDEAHDLGPTSSPGSKRSRLE